MREGHKNLKRMAGRNLKREREIGILRKWDNGI